MLRRRLRSDHSWSGWRGLRPWTGAASTNSTRIRPEVKVNYYITAITPKTNVWQLVYAIFLVKSRLTLIPYCFGGELYKIKQNWTRVCTVMLRGPVRLPHRVTANVVACFRTTSNLIGPIVFKTVVWPCSAGMSNSNHCAGRSLEKHATLCQF